MKRTILSPEQRQEVVEKYKSGRLIISLANEYGVDRAAIRRILDKNLVQKHSPRLTHRTYKLNENSFLEPLTKESLYWIGFLLADGNLYNRRNHEFIIQIGLAAIDAEHLEKFKRFLETDRPLNFYNGGPDNGHPSVKISINSKPIYQNLEKLGLTPRKSFTANIRHDITKSFDFWRGVIDGDGSYFNAYKNTTISVILSKNMAEHYATFIKEQYGYDVKMAPHTMSPNMIICHIRHMCIVQKFIADMFYEKCVCLERKEKLAQAILLKQYQDFDKMGRSRKNSNSRLREEYK